jgi:hypothetical protein
MECPMATKLKIIEDVADVVPVSDRERGWVTGLTRTRRLAAFAAFAAFRGLLARARVRTGQCQLWQLQASGYPRDGQVGQLCPERVGGFGAG